MAAQRKQLRAMFETVAQLKGSEDEELQMKTASDVLQRKGPDEEELLQGKFQSMQRQAPEEDELLQGKFASRAKPTQFKSHLTMQENRTGMPDHLKSGIETLSGLSMDHVRVHYNSWQPAQLNALAYARGTDIHVAPGQEQHLPHEAWHVVQQAQGRVQPTTQMKDGVPVNNDKGLEAEADVVGAKAWQMRGPDPSATGFGLQDATTGQRAGETSEASEVQGKPLTVSMEKMRLHFLSTPGSGSGSLAQQHALQLKVLSDKEIEELIDQVAPVKADSLANYAKRVMAGAPQDAKRPVKDKAVNEEAIKRLAQAKFDQFIDSGALKKTVEKERKTLSANGWRHIWRGDIGAAGRPTGFHWKGKENDALHEGHGEATEGAGGFYRQAVRLRASQGKVGDSVDGKKVISIDKADRSTFFPDDWTDVDVKDAVETRNSSDQITTAKGYGVKLNKSGETIYPLI